MRRRGWLAIGGCVLAGVIVVAVVGGGTRRGDPPDPSATASNAVVPTFLPTPTPTASPAPTSSPTSRPTPVRSAAATAPPRATGDPRLAYAEFLLRVNDDRTAVEGLNRALSSAAEAQDPKAVTTAAVDILDFVDGERDWLREHPPAACYAAAHASANAMLDAYGAAADRFIMWADAGGGLGGLAALGDALAAADTAADALTAFGKALEATTCPT
jgi:hypothetical protein